MKKKFPIGVAHGRFQILHNDHLKYINSCKDLCNHLVIGITNPDPNATEFVKINPHGSDKLSNPLTYFERYEMVRLTLLDEGFESDSFSIVPFPINRPSLIHYYAPMDATFFLSIYDSWGQQKLETFNSIGLKTHVLWKVKLKEKGISGFEVRNKLLEDNGWEEDVPPAVQKLIKQWDIKKRLLGFQTILA